MVLKHDIFLCLQFIFCASCSDFKSKGRDIEIHFWYSFHRFIFGTHFKGYSMEETRITNTLYFLVK